MRGPKRGSLVECYRVWRKRKGCTQASIKDRDRRELLAEMCCHVESVYCTQY